MDREIEIKLKQLLKDRKMEQKDIVAITGLSTRAVSEFTNNKVERIPKTTLVKISEALELDDIRDLIDFKDKQKE